MKIYKYEEWSMIPSETPWDRSTNLYIDVEDNPITGILEDFYYFKANDKRNNVEVINGKRNSK